MRDPYPKSSGNALFLILIAVALFAALSYAVSRSGRGGGDISRETALLNAATVVQYASGIRSTVTRMVLLGTNAADLDFSSAAGGTDAVFDSSGGGAIFQTIPASIQTSGALTDEYRYFPDGNIEGVGTAADDVVMFVPWLTQEICREINRGLGLPADPPDMGALGAAALASGVAIPVDAALCAGCVGEPFICVDSLAVNPDLYMYYHVLVER